MYTTGDIYKTYRHVQASINQRGYRLPKDFNHFGNNKLKSHQRENIQTITNYFNTKGQDIDIEKYFEAGFQVYKNFSYHQFLDKKIIEMYKRLDKLEKIKSNYDKETILKDVKYILTTIDKNNDLCKTGGVLKGYCRQKDDRYVSYPILDYVNNNISNITLTGLISEKMFILSDLERAMIPSILDNYRDNLKELNDMDDFLDKLKRRINTMSKQYGGKPLNNKSPSGEMLYGDKTEKERKNEEKQYKEKQLNE